MKPQPLNLEKIESIILDGQVGKLTFDGMMKKIKQKIKSSCKFYLIYKDNAEEFEAEHEELIKKDCVEIYTNPNVVIDKNGDIINYNEWLFKITFKDVIEDG